MPISVNAEATAESSQEISRDDQSQMYALEKLKQSNSDLSTKIDKNIASLNEKIKNLEEDNEYLYEEINDLKAKLDQKQNKCGFFSTLERKFLVALCAFAGSRYLLSNTDAGTDISSACTRTVFSACKQIPTNPYVVITETDDEVSISNSKLGNISFQNTAHTGNTILSALAAILAFINA